MIVFTIRRLIQLVLVVFAGATLLFFLCFALPGNPAEFAVGGQGRVPDKQVLQNKKKEYRLDKPILVQYGHYMRNLLHGDFGKAFRTTTVHDSKSVNAIIKERAPLSIRLAFWAIVIEIVVGIAFGTLSARRRNSFADTATTISAVVASAIPVFVLGFLVIQLTGVYANDHNWPMWARFPPRGFGPNKWYLGIIPGVSQIKPLVQPAIVLAAVSTAILTRIVRTTILETTRFDHVRTARAKGLSESQIMRRHILRNAMIPVVTVVGIDFGTAAGAAVLTETVFNLNGIGHTIVQAADISDFPAVLGLSIVVMLIYGVANLVVDMSYAVLDPRVRLGGAK